MADLDAGLLKIVADQVSPGISADRCLQYLGLAEYDVATGLRIRRAALLLFAKSTDKWHPRVQVRILKVNGTSLGAGASYNVTSDQTVKECVLKLIDESWDHLRPHLVLTRFQEDARFKTTYIYPEVACREALVNAIAHRDYSEEGRGVEIFIFDDRIEIKNPGSLLSSVSLEEIRSLSGVHQSRNTYIARALREVGYMRELGEGMRRIFELMQSNELAPPEINVDLSSFSLTLHHRAMYSKEEMLWLGQFDSLSLSSEEKAVILIGRRGDLIAPNDIIRKVGIVDIENYRQIVHSLQTKGILESVVTKATAKSKATKLDVSVRDVPRFRVRLPREGLLTPPTRRRQAKKISQTIEAGPDDSKAVFVANLPPNTTDRDLVRTFRELGEVVSVHLPRTDGLSKGYAFVEFEKIEEATAVLNTAVQLGGRTLVVKPKLPRKFSNTPTRRAARGVHPSRGR